MEKFTALLDEHKVATQIATLLNSYNKLSKLHTDQSIITSNIKYFIEQRLLNKEITVVGCIGVDMLYMNSIFLRHLSIHPLFRKLGIASSLIKKAQKYYYNISNIYMDIRSDNYASLSLAEKEGFLVVQIKNKTNYNIVTVGKINDFRN